MANISGPSSFTFDAVTSALLVTFGGGGSTVSTNIAQILGNTVALSNPLPVELSDGTNAFGTAGNPLSVNVISGGGANASVGLTGATAPTSATEIGTIDGTGKLQGASTSNPVPINEASWGGTAVQAAATGSNDGTGANPVLRNIPRRFGQIVTTAALGANGVFTGAWIDTNQTGDLFVQATVRADQASAANGYQIQEADDTTDANFQFNITHGAASNPNTGITVAANTTTVAYAQVRRRYWRIVYTNGATLQGSFKLTVQVADKLIAQQVGASGAVVSGALPVLIGGVNAGSLAPDANAAPTSVFDSQVLPYKYAPNGATSSWYYDRTPIVFRSAAANAGLNTIWTPATGKKFRLMRYRIEAEADIAQTTGGNDPLVLMDGTPGAGQGLGLGLMHNPFVPAAAGSTLGPIWATDWIDLGNGPLSGVANNPLVLGINGPLASTTQNAGFTQTSGQWEAFQFLFKTRGSKGPTAFLRSISVFAPASTNSAVLAIGTPVPGDVIVVFAAQKNGAATLTISDTAGNVWTSGTAQQNATDTMTLRGFFATAVAAAADSITVASSATAQMKIIVLTYSGLTTNDASSGTTGNTAAPAPGNATAASVSDVTISAASNGGASNAIAAAGAYQLQRTSSDANSTLSVEDSLNQAPAGLAGAFTITTAGTEE